MKKADVVIGETYVAKVSSKLAPVRIVSESQYGGWNAVNTATNRDVRIRGAARLRRIYKPKASQTSPELMRAFEFLLGD